DNSREVSNEAIHGHWQRWITVSARMNAGGPDGTVRRIAPAERRPIRSRRDEALAGEAQVKKAPAPAASAQASCQLELRPVNPWRSSTVPPRIATMAQVARIPLSGDPGSLAWIVGKSIQASIPNSGGCARSDSARISRFPPGIGNNMIPMTRIAPSIALFER